MKKVLCFGDSNTYGFNPSDGSRYSKDVRWCGRLKKLGFEKFEVVEAGCNNRTAFCDNPQGIDFTGYKAIEKYFGKHFDLIVLAIGVNDIQKIYNVSVEDFEKGLESFVNLVKTSFSNSKILLVAPSNLKKIILQSYFGALFDENSIEKSLKLSEIYKKVAKISGCEFMDLNEVTEASDIDGLHYTEEQHGKISHAVFQKICKIICD